MIYILQNEYDVMELKDIYEQFKNDWDIKLFWTYSDDFAFDMLDNDNSKKYSANILNSHKKQIGNSLTYYLQPMKTDIIKFAIKKKSFV